MSFIIKSGYTGKYFLAPGEGSTIEIESAHRYTTREEAQETIDIWGGGERGNCEIIERLDHATSMTATVMRVNWDTDSVLIDECSSEFFDITGALSEIKADNALEGAPRMKKKMKKDELFQDTVNSSGFHVGIELELVAPFPDGSRGHDDDACREGAEESRREDLDGQTNEDLCRFHMGLNRSEAQSMARFLDREALIDNLMDDWTWDGCNDDDCSHRDGEGEEEQRRKIQKELLALTGNKSFKVVHDGSVEHDETEEFSAEVCWNYFASKDTIKDNARILAKLHDLGMKFNPSCGLHINLNNYLHVEAYDIPTKKLDFLFNFVADSRRTSDYCNRMGLSSTEEGCEDQKYSMIYHQGDRFEFRFFSPTLDARKLHHYVVLANVVYKRLAGKAAKLPKKTERYFFEKMTTINGRSKTLAQIAIDSVNTLKSLEELANEPSVPKRKVIEETETPTTTQDVDTFLSNAILQGTGMFSIAYDAQTGPVTVETLTAVRDALEEESA